MWKLLVYENILPEYEDCKALAIKTGIPPSPPFSKGGNIIPPLKKGDVGGFETGYPDETLDEIEDVRILQKKKGHRFTTDSILLARLSTPKKHERVLELGTGCGIVSIILSKRIP